MMKMVFGELTLFNTFFVCGGCGGDVWVGKNIWGWESF